MQADTLPPHGLQYRVAIGGSYRLATSLTDSAQNLLDIPTGEGGGFEVRSALDVLAGRVGGTVAGRYAKSFTRSVNAPLIGGPQSGWPYPLFGPVRRTAGDVLGVDLMPRVYLGEWLALEGQYGFEHTAAPTIVSDSAVNCSSCAPLGSSLLAMASTVQRVGIGVRYSTIDAYLRGRARYPIEVSFRHFETITGDPGTPKLFRDQIQMRIYYRVRR
jgi:hypothetical protein